MITFKSTQRKTKSYEELETALTGSKTSVNVNANATTKEEAFTNALEDILSKATEDIFLMDSRSRNRYCQK